MAYHVSFDGPILVIRLFGTLTDADLEAIADEVAAIEDGGQNTPPRLADVRDVDEPAIGYAEIARFAERTRTRPLSASVRSAILVDQPVQLGFARMFQILNEHPRVTLQIFDNETTAREWLLGRIVNPGL